MKWIIVPKTAGAGYWCSFSMLATRRVESVEYGIGLGGFDLLANHHNKSIAMFQHSFRGESSTMVLLFLHSSDERRK